MVQSKRQKYMFLLFSILPTLIVFTILTVYPLTQGLYMSFFDWSGMSAEKEFIGIDNYIKLFNDPIIRKAISNDYLLVVIKVIFIMIIATFFAVVLTQFRIKESPIYRVIFFFPNIMSVVIMGVLWMFIFNPKFGMINEGLKALGLEQWTRPWLGDQDWALPSLAVPLIWAGIGLFMLMLMGAIMNVPKSLYEAAEMDGASQWIQFWKVTVPLVWPQIKTAIIYIVITTLNGSFVLVQIMTEGGPNNATQVMGSYLYQQAFKNFNFGYGATIGVLILVLSLITVMILQFVLKRDKVEL
ncbi:sugar ABC transporter permease [Neobacillus sp. 179-J 1A1 HS]|uniref:carbohydrate ABC transporter permease n=1 Tax=Neobacillus driksii TaxID=3035913 RepID=UPI0035BBDC37